MLLRVIGGIRARRGILGGGGDYWCKDRELGEGNLCWGGKELCLERIFEGFVLGGEERGQRFVLGAYGERGF